MTSKLKLLIKDGLNKKIKTKWFKWVNIILVILIVGIINIDSIIKFFGGDFDDPVDVYINDETSMFYESIKSNYELNNINITDTTLNFKKLDKSIDELKSEMLEEESNDIILNINKYNDSYKAEIISYDYVDGITIQLLTTAINSAKTGISLLESDIDVEELTKINEPITIDRIFLSDEIDENNEMIEYIGSYLIPIFIVPFFLLILMVTSMIGAEINEEKSSKSMEIIVSSVDPKIHFISKIITSNLYAIIQALLFVFYFVIGLGIRMYFSSSSLLDSFGEETSTILHSFLDSEIFNAFVNSLPIVIIMILLSFIAYSLLAGILASMTTSQEDYQQLQTPMMILIMAGYFLAIMSSTYEKSSFIIIVSMIPFISCILSPVLLIMGQISLMEVGISVLLLLGVIYLLIKYGIRIYKVGILNYSSSNLWKKMLNSLKLKD